MTTPALVAFLVFLTLQRIWELRLSSRHTSALERRDAREFGRGHFPALIVLHGLFPVALAAEVWLGGARPTALWPMWLGLLVSGQIVRLAAIRALGEFWNVRIWVVPGMTPVRRGPYRFLRHPNYLAVVLELASAPMMFGAWRTAIAISVLNAILLAIRIRAEERALRWAAQSHRDATISSAEPAGTPAGTGSSTRSTSNVMSS